MSKRDWYSCDGYGQVKSRRKEGVDRMAPTIGFTRRSVLTGIGIGALTWLSKGSALSQIAVGPRPGNQVVVVLFLRGAADMLSLVVPYREDAYYRARPNLSIPAPRTARSSVIDLNGQFGFHPSLQPLEKLFKEGQMGIVHACGSDDNTRSHFEAMSAMERGLARQEDGPGDGWIARHLATTHPSTDSPLRAVAIGSTMPDSLRGATHTVLMESVKDYKIAMDQAEQRRWITSELAKMYGPGEDEVAKAGRDTLDVLSTLNHVQQPSSSGQYPDSDLGRGLREVATLIRAKVGLEIACLDKGGWDTHVGQGVTVGLLPGLLDDLAKSIRAFTDDLGPDMSKVSLVVMSEFGRRLEENTGLGTDHGHGSAMFVMGGGVKGGKVYTKWPGLEKNQLTGPGDLIATTDYRDVLGELLSERLGNQATKVVFAGYSPKPLGLFGAST